MEKVGQDLFHAVGRFQGERGHGKVHRHFGQAVPHIKWYRVKHGAHSGAAGGGAPHREIPPFAVPQFALVGAARAAGAYIAQRAGAGQHQGQVAIAQGSGGHRGTVFLPGCHSTHGGQGGFRLHQQATGTQAHILCRRHWVGYIQPQPAEHRQGRGIPKLRQIVCNHARKAGTFQRSQAAHGIRFHSAESSAGQLQQRFAAQGLRHSVRFPDGQDQITQLGQVFGTGQLGSGFKTGGQLGYHAYFVLGVFRQGDFLCGQGRRFTALLQQLVQRFAAHLIPGGAGQKSGAALAAGKLNPGAGERRTAGFAQGALNAGGGVFLCGLRFIGAVHIDTAAVVVESCQFDAAVLHTAADAEMHRNALQFAAEQLAGFRRGGARSGCIGFGAHAKHGAVIAACQIGITEAGAGENIPQQRFIIGLPGAGCAAGRYRSGGIFRRAQAAFNFNAGNPGGFQLGHVGHKVHVFQAQVAGFARLAGAQAVGSIKRQAAGTRAGTAIAAAPAQERAHHALAAHGHAHRAVYKHFAFDRACLYHGFDLRQAQLTGQNGAGIPQLCQHLGALCGVDAHLGRAVQAQARRNAAHQLRGGKVIHNHGIRPGGGNSAHGIGQAAQLGGVNQRVQGYMHRNPAGMTKTDGFAQGIRVKVPSAAPRIVAIQPKIYGVSPGKHRSPQHISIAGGGQDLRAL